MKRRRGFIIPILIVVVLIIGYFSIKDDKKTTLIEEVSNFAIDDKKQVDKIFISGKLTDETVLLEKQKDDSWLVNGEYPVDNAKLDLLLNTLKNVKVKYPVSKAQWDYTIKSLSSRGVKTEIYSGNKLLKTLYVGGPTPDHEGTFMYLEGSKEPFVCHIPGFVGYLTPRFITSEQDWRSKIIFRHTAEDIEWVKVEWPEEPNNSFEITNQNNAELKSTDGKVIKGLNQNKVNSYLNMFELIAFDGFPLDMKDKDIDSVYNQTTPFFVLTLKARNQVPKKIQLHRKGLKMSSKAQYNELGDILPYELGNYYAFIDDNKSELLQVQDFVFSKLLKKVEDFKMD